MYLLFEEFFPRKGDAGKRLLHVAPELFMRAFFASRFDTYHTADLFMKGVDFKEDLQRLSFPDGSYDCVVISRVLPCPPNMNACISEIRRVLSPGGVAIIAEFYPHEKTVEFGRFVGERSRELGVDALDLYRRHFKEVELVSSDRYDPAYQLHNRMLLDGKPCDAYPQLTRMPGIGFKDVVAICRV